MSYLTILISILTLIPALIDAIKAIEAAIPGKDKGTDKLQAIKTTIEAVNEEAIELWPYIEKVIAGLVFLFNKTGLFKKD